MLGVILTALLSATSQASDCVWKLDYVSEQASVIVEAGKAEALDPGLSIAAVVRKIGPAKRDSGSGIHVLEWQLSDGRRLRIGAPDACSRPMHRAVLPKGGA